MLVAQEIRVSQCELEASLVGRHGKDALSSICDPELLEELRRRARAGSPRARIAGWGRQELPGASRSLAEFEGIDQGQRERSVVPLSEGEAMRLVVEEQHAWRREHRFTGRKTSSTPT